MINNIFSGFIQGSIICKTEMSGWYPKALFKGNEGLCVFETPKEVDLLDNHYGTILSEMGK